MSAGPAGPAGSAASPRWAPLKRPWQRAMRAHAEGHRSDRSGWLRAAVLGANDGIVSTASLLLGMAAAQASHATLLATGVAGLVAGAMSMAAGEYVSVHTQADTEAADLAREAAELQASPAGEQRELMAIYVARGLTPSLAQAVSAQLMLHDALGAHARDELGLTEALVARPLQAAAASAASFAAGAALPLAVTALVPGPGLIGWISVSALLFLVGLGWLAAQAGGAPVARSVWRVSFWGAGAMAATALVGAWFGASVGA